MIDSTFEFDTKSRVITSQSGSPVKITVNYKQFFKDTLGKKSPNGKK